MAVIGWVRGRSVFFSAFIPGLYITVGQPFGILCSVSQAIKVMASRKVAAVELAVPHFVFSFFSAPFPPSPLLRETNQRSEKVSRHSFVNGSSLAILPLHGSQNPESRATLNSIFSWNFGICENRMIRLFCLVIILIVPGWHSPAILMVIFWR